MALVFRQMDFFCSAGDYLEIYFFFSGCIWRAQVGVGSLASSYNGNNVQGYTLT